MITWKLESPASRLKEPHLGCSEDPSGDIPSDPLGEVRDHGRGCGKTRTQTFHPEPGTETLPRPIPRGVDLAAIEARLHVLALSPTALGAVADPKSLATHELYRRNIENFIGTVKIPVGVAGPLRLKGTFAQGDYYIPLATTEAALVASYNRGTRIVTAAGGCVAMIVAEGVTRAPGFAFTGVGEAVRFVRWANARHEEIKKVAEKTTRHGKLEEMKFTVEGNHVYAQFAFTTGDASGQNMVTIATEAICAYIRERSPVRPREWFVEANFSGDKKATSRSFQSVRGKKVVAEVRIPKGLVEEILHTSPEQMSRYFQLSTLGSVLSGALGNQGHYANGLAALYLACGQDAACVAESATGVSRFEVAEEGDLYASVTLPNLMVGTVGGGTGLPSQKACLDIMGLSEPGKAAAFAEVAAGLCLAAELSIAAAICAGEFTQAHERLARRRPDSLPAR
ncbi:MAG TPA: hydroxymethylglutaryl-CoA reductase [Syntrophobacteria bacterium]|nr:hydroxymethylglutaryl-CoA reductase [Syntrophobacteria bacterium]